MRPSNPIMISAASATSSQTSVALDASFIVCGSFQIISSSASNSGTLQMQFSNDPASTCTTSSTGNLVPVNWSNLGTAATVTDGALASVEIPQSTYAGYRWLQAVWTPGSGDGTITVNGFTLGA